MTIDDDFLDDTTPPLPYTLDRLAYTTAPGESPLTSPYGCVILADGTTHTLRRQHTHGMLLALLFPEQAKTAGYAPPDEDSSVFNYQRFELDHQATLPAVRIATGIFSTNLSKSDAPATQAQVTAALAYLRGVGMKPGDKVQMEMAEVSVSKVGGLLLLDDAAMRTKLWSR